MYDITKSYSDNKKCWSPGSGDLPCLSDMPQVKALYNHAYKEIDILERYCSSIQSRLSKVLKEETIPDSDLVEAIAVAKIEAVTASMDLVYLLKREVGSFALMGGTGFEFNDFFLCCAFAEGDTRILMQKIARDKFKSFKSQSWEITGKSLVLGSEIIKKETQALIELTNALNQTNSKNESDSLKAWNDNYDLVYGLARLVCKRHIERAIGTQSSLSSKSLASAFEISKPKL